MTPGLPASVQIGASSEHDATSMVKRYPGIAKFFEEVAVRRLRWLTFASDGVSTRRIAAPRESKTVRYAEVRRLTTRDTTMASGAASKLRSAPILV